jgi:hypothetical protein
MHGPLLVALLDFGAQPWRPMLSAYIRALGAADNVVVSVPSAHSTLTHIFASKLCHVTFMVTQPIPSLCPKSYPIVNHQHHSSNCTSMASPKPPGKVLSGPYRLSP